MIIRKLIPVNITKTDKFQMMPVSSKLLFFEMLVRSDDAGFLNNAASVLDKCGASLDDLNLLISKGFVRFVKDKTVFMLYLRRFIFMNETKLSGRLTKDPVVRYTSSGKVVTQFILAVDRIRKDDKNEADFIPVVFWGKSAEIIGNSLKKGSKILVDGRIQVRSYDAKDGSKRWVTEVIGRRFEYMESKSSNASSGSFSTFGKEEPVPFNEPFDEEIQF